MSSNHVVRSAVGMTLALALVGCGVQANQTAALRAANGVVAESVPGELIVKFKNSATRGPKLLTLGLRQVRSIDKIGAVVVKGGDTKTALAALKADADVLYAEPNYVAKAFDLPSMSPNVAFGIRAEDELLKDCWGMNTIHASDAWKVTTGANVKVAVVDTGVDYTHPDLAGRVDKGHDFVNNDDDAKDDHYHGTHCAGTIGAGLGNGGVVGVAPNVSIVAVKVLSASGSGSYDGVAAGITYAADSGASILSMSLGGPSSSKALEDAVKYAQSKGVLIVAAMGNSGNESVSYPAGIPGVMPIGATDINDKRASFSQYGKHISVSAPGVDVLSTVPGGGFKKLSGTSMATPHTAGLCALVKSAFPDFTADQIRAKVEASTDDQGDAGWDKYFGTGRINALKAVSPARR
ncbi:MAG: peptidase [Cyanobacteria bacterium RYN_339]|nr:peptidase [Cyanobacteria bacterium RYN_339]